MTNKLEPSLHWDTIYTHCSQVFLFHVDRTLYNSEQSQHSIFSTMSYSNSNVNGGLDPFIIETPKTLRETDGRPRRIIACVACRKRRGRVSTSTFYFFVIVFISSRLQCKKPEESPKADCAFCRSRGIRCVVGQSLYIECLYMLSSESCIQPGNLGSLT